MGEVETAHTGTNPEATLKTAHQNGIARLYHYEKFNAEYLSTTLQDRKVRWTNTAYLNDPWDCKPWFDARSLQDPNVFEQEMAWFHSLAKEPLPPDLKEKMESDLRSDPNRLAKFMAGQSESLQQMIFERRIYCLTPISNSTLMWSHYAERHSGICLEFGVDNDLFSSALEVVYRAEYPIWIPHQIAARREQSLAMILTKASDWCYEKEYRLISRRLPGDYFCLPSGALKSIIAGCEAKYAAISDVVKTHMPALPIKRVVRAGNHYRLEIEG